MVVRHPSSSATTFMDAAIRHALLQQLGEAMSEISEQCYYAGWLGGTEYLVPELCIRALATGQTQAWGHSEVTPGRAGELISLAEKVGSWANLDEAGVGFVPHQPFPMPREYAESVEREQLRRRVGRDEEFQVEQ